MSPTILTHSGLNFNLQYPDPDLIEIEDIAHALAKICRFTGHTKYFYSVAEHSVLASYLTPSDFALEALLHDAAEAYIGDVSTPLKSLLPDYRIVEFRVEQAIRTRFALPPTKSSFVKIADMRMLATEKRDLMPSTDEEWDCIAHTAPINTSVRFPMPSDLAKKSFLDRFDSLTKGAR